MFKSVEVSGRRWKIVISFLADRIEYVCVCV